MSLKLLALLAQALWETCYMLLLSGGIALLIGLPLGIFLHGTQAGGLLSQPKLHKVLAAIVNCIRSIPFIILMVAIIPLTRFITGTSIGTTAAIVPLSLCAIPFLARIVEHALIEVPIGLTEAGHAMGATPWQIIRKILLPEALPGIVRGFTLTLISLVGYTAMAGAVGGGGLGNLAINYGYQRFDTKIMFATVVILICLVQLLQYLGDHIVRRLLHR